MQLISLMISLAMRYRRALLAAEDDGSGGYRGAGGTPEPVVDSDQLQNVQVLVLVLVQALHLYIEQRVRICNNSVRLLDKTGQNLFVIGLDSLPVPLKVDLSGERLEAPNNGSGQRSSASARSDCRASGASKRMIS